MGKFIEASREGKRKPFKCVFHCIKTCDPEKTPYCISSALMNAMKGNLDKGFVFCGANVGRVDRIISVHELMETLRKEYQDILRNERPLYFDNKLLPDIRRETGVRLFLCSHHIRRFPYIHN
jgi:hypothetical protein